MDSYVTWLAVLTAIPAVASPVVHSLTRWRESPMGIHLMFYMLVLALTFGLLTIDQFIRPDPLWFEALQVGVFTFTPVVMWWRLALQVQALRYHATHKANPAPEERNARHDDQP